MSDLRRVLDDLAERLCEMDAARDTDPTGRSHWEGYDKAARECGRELRAILAAHPEREAGR